MWRYLAGVASALLLVAAGVFLFRSSATAERPQPPAPRQAAQAERQVEAADDVLPVSSPKTREQRRFGRYDKDDDGIITRDEYLASRRKAFAKLDTNGDGRLAFDEWATKTTGKFAAADRDRSGSLNPTEFATTAVTRKTRQRTPCVLPNRQEAD